MSIAAIVALLQSALLLLTLAQAPNVPPTLKTQAVTVANQAIAAATQALGAKPSVSPAGGAASGTVLPAPGAPVSTATPPVPTVMTGYWSIGNINAVGDFISETAAESNIAMIPPDESGSFALRASKASALGLKNVLMIRDTLFSTHGGNLYPDYETRFIKLWDSLAPLQGSIVGFYLIDEPYINNAGTIASERLSESQLKTNLTNAISAIKRVAPGRPVMFTEGVTHVRRGDFASLIPSNLDYIGANCYMYLEASGCTEADVSQTLQTLSTAMQPHQKLIVTADGYIPDLPPGYSAFSDEVLRSRIIFWEHALAPYMATGKVGAFTPFIYHSVGNSINGLNEFPKSRSEIARYMQSIKDGAPLPKAMSNLGASAHITASNTYLDQGAARVVDGNISTGWNSGGYAPQWIQFDLGEAYRIAEMLLNVGQSPSGKTTHTIQVSQTGAAWTPLETFSRETATGDVLKYSSALPPYGIRYVKVETTESPSWVAWPEISITGY